MGKSAYIPKIYINVLTAIYVECVKLRGQALCLIFCLSSCLQLTSLTGRAESRAGYGLKKKKKKS